MPFAILEFDKIVDITNPDTIKEAIRKGQFDYRSDTKSNDANSTYIKYQTKAKPANKSAVLASVELAQIKNQEAVTKVNAKIEYINDVPEENPIDIIVPIKFYFICNETVEQKCKVTPEMLNNLEGYLFSKIKDVEKTLITRPILKEQNKVILILSIKDAELQAIMIDFFSKKSEIALGREIPLNSPNIDISYSLQGNSSALDEGNFVPLQKNPRIAFSKDSIFQSSPNDAQNQSEFINLFTDEKLSKSEQAFIQKLSSYFHKTFPNISNKEKLNILLQFSSNTDFMTHMVSNWKMACLFIDKITRKDPELLVKLASTPYAHIYKLNSVRALAIGDDTGLSTIQQQKIILEIFAPNWDPGQKSGFMTQYIDHKEKEGKLEIPDELLCPITLGLLRDPVAVVTPLGKKGEVKIHLFERDVIERLIQDKKPHPITRAELKKEDIIPAPQEILDKLAEFKKGIGQEAVAKKIKEMIGSDQNTNHPNNLADPHF